MSLKRQGRVTKMLFSGRGYVNHLKGACLNKMLFFPPVALDLQLFLRALFFPETFTLSHPHVTKIGWISFLF